MAALVLAAGDPSARDADGDGTAETNGDGILTNVEARAILGATAENIGLSANEQGNGLVDAENAALGTTSGDNLGGGGGDITNSPPTADFSFTTNGLAASFTDGSTDSGGSIAAWAWDFDTATDSDGDLDPANDEDSTAQNPSNTYSAGGTYNVKLTVTDNDGATDSVAKDVTVSEGGGGGGTFSLSVFLRHRGWQER